MNTFALVLDEAAQLSLDEQEQLADTLRRRVAEQRREQIIRAVKESRAELAAHKLKGASVTAIMKKIRA